MNRRVLNPYVVGVPLTEDVGFYGREDIFRFVRDSLSSPHQNVIVLFGQRRIGKTSLLRQLPRHLPPDFHSVYFDLQGRARHMVSKVLCDLASAIAKSLELPEPKEANFKRDPNYFQVDFLPTAYEKLGEKRLVLLFDEFDVLGDEPLTGEAAAETLFPFLQQQIMDEPQLVFVFVVGRRIEELPTHYQAIFKQAQYRSVSLLRREDAMELITKPAEGILEYDPAAIDAILDLTACHPYFTQLVCSEIFNYLRRREKKQVSAEAVNAVVERAIESGTGGLTWFWDGLPRAERFVLSAIAQVTDQGGMATQEQVREILQRHRVRLLGLELTNAPDTLVRWEILERKDTGGYRFVVELVRRWIIQEHPLERAKRDIDFVSQRAARYYANARDAHLIGDLDAAIGDYRRALAANPNHSGAQLGLAQALYEQGNITEAIVEYEKAYQFDEASARDGLIVTRLTLGESLEKEGQMDQAIAEYEAVLALAPSDEHAIERLTSIWMEQADVHLAADRLDEALRLYQQVLEVEPASARARELKERIEYELELVKLFDQAMMAHKAGEWKVAEKEWLELLKRDRIEYREQDIAKLLVEAREQQRLSEKLSPLYDQGVEHLNNKQWQKAIAQFEQVVEVDAGYRDAAQLLTKAREEVLSEKLSALYDQGVKHLNNMQWQKAIAQFEQLIEVDAGFRDAAKLLDRARQQQRLASKPVVQPKPKARPSAVSEKGPSRSIWLVAFAVLILIGIVAISLAAGFSVGVLIIAAATLVIGYGWYARTIDEDIIQPDPGKATPAKMYMDGVDFTPASRNVLFGYQFKSISTLAPITGPIVAVQWGWLPALIWIFLGTFFIGWVQDYGALIMGVRREGDTMGALSYKLISPRARNILLIFVYFYLLLIMGAFGNAVGKSLLVNPKVPFGIIFVTLMGILAGQMTYKWKQDIILTTVVTVVLTFVGIWVSTLPFMSNIFVAIYGFPDSPTIFLGNTQAQVLGTLLVIIFCYLGAVRPVWSFAQPVNYVSFWIVMLGMVGGVIGLLIWRPGRGDFPAYTQFTTASGPLWPMLFVTIAGGAISGWHSLVSTSSTARQLEKETDALPVGGGAMFMEMAFAVIAFLTATTAFGGWLGYQDAGGPGAALGVFAGGLAQFLQRIGIPFDFGVAYGSVFLTIMALTVMPLAVRFMRMTSAELVGDAVPAMRNIHVGSIVALILTLLFVWVIPWLTIWAVFGAANQLMAGLALLLVSLWLMSGGRKHTWALYPSAFMIITAIAALLYVAYTNLIVKLPAAASVQSSLTSALVGIIALVLVVAAAFLVVDGWRAIRQART